METLLHVSYKFRLFSLIPPLFLAKQQVADFMKASGVESDSKTLDIFFARIEGQTVTDLVKAGKEKHISMPCGGGGGGAAASAGPAAEAPKEEEKKEEAEDVDMGGLFGDDDDY